MASTGISRPAGLQHEHEQVQLRTPALPRERLASLKDPRMNRKTRAARVPPRPRCPSCKGSNVVEIDGNTVCEDCGTSISESNIVAEVTFGESATGAAVIQGGFVGEGQRHARSLGQAFRRAGGMESREVAENFGRDEIRRLATRVHLSENIADQAFAIYKLAANANFIQGRRVTVVAAACLYIACRRDPHNQTLLMDFSEIITVNVFKLGQTYNDLKKTLWIDPEQSSGIRPVIEVENLIMKFARKLEFGNALMRVAEDAAKIVKRMKRDWMVTGRRPAGLCGACIILAARMNNFRRTVREVVYVVKVADMTVAKRIEEFKNTQSGDLTVDQFREYGVRLKKQHDPPALIAAAQREKKRRKLSSQASDADGLSSDEAQGPLAHSGPNTRVDADGFTIPDVPGTQTSHAVTDNNDDDDESDPDSGRPRKRQRKKAAKTRKPITHITEEDLVVEDELEREIDSIVNDPAAMLNMEESAMNDSQERAQALASSLRGVTTTVAPVRSDPVIDEDEFDDDPEVANCLLSEEERKIKERIWVTHNEDWLRAQQAKMLKKALDEASGANKKPKRRRRKGRLGDGSVLEGGGPIENAADASARMLEKRGKGFSKHIDYSKLEKFYAQRETETAANTESEATSEAGSRMSSVALDEQDSRAAAPPGPAATRTRATNANPRGAADAEGQAGPQKQSDGHGDEEGEDEEEDEDDEDEDEDEDEEEEEEEDMNEDAERVMDQFGLEAGDYDEDENVGFEYDEDE